MKANRRICLVVSIIAFACSLASWVTYSAQENAKREAYYKEQEELKARGEMTFSGPYCYPDRHPRFLLLLSTFSVSGLLVLLIAKNVIWALPAFLSGLLMFPYWVWTTRWALSMAENPGVVEGLDRVLYRANSFDLATATCLSLLVVYQSVLLFNAMRTAVTPSKLP